MEDSIYSAGIRDMRSSVDDRKNEGGGKLTSLVILTHNQLECTKKCIESIFKCTDETFELILVDNGSTDGTVEYLERVRSQGSKKEEAEEMEAEAIPQAAETSCVNVKVIRNHKNMGFAAGNNQGISVARGDYILLMNNDVVVPPYWLRRMIACMERNPRAGIVGPITNYVSGPQLFENVTYDTIRLEGLNEFAAAFAKRYEGQSELFLRVVGFCMLIRRAVIDKIGGLDERYGLGNFEDDDFCLRAALAGFESWIVKDCFVHHFGSRTFVGANIDYRESLDNNWEVFKGKWGIPSEVPYGFLYDVSSILEKSFDPQVHYFPLKRKTSWMLPSRQADETLEKCLREGEQLFLEGRYEEAKEIFRAAVLEYPNHPKALNNLACVFWKLGQKPEALQTLIKTMEIKPDGRDAVWNLGQFLKEMGRDREAREIYCSYLNGHPDEEEMADALHQWVIASNKAHDRQSGEEKSPGQDGLLECARALLKEGHYREAEQVLGGILKDHPDDHNASNVLACLTRETVRTKEDLQELARVLDAKPEDRDTARNPGQFLIYQPFLKHHPDDLDMREAPRQGSGGHHGSLDRVCSQGERLAASGLREEAKEIFWNVLEADEEFALAYNNLACLYWQEGDVESALREVIRAVELAPHDADVVWNCGRMLQGLGRAEEAMEIFNRYLEAHPEAEDIREAMAGR